MKKIFFIILFNLFSLKNLHALIEIDITRGNLDPLPIAVSPLHVDISSEKVENLKLSMSQGSGLLAWLSILFLAGFTPLPYKAFTISSGLIAFNLPIFIIVSLISRSLRFFIVAYLSYKFGELFTEYMEKHGSKWFTIIGIIIVIIVIFIYFFLKFNG